MLLCPWDFPGKNTGVGNHFLLQGIFLTQEPNPHLLHWQVGSLPLSHQGNPHIMYICMYKFIWSISLTSAILQWLMLSPCIWELCPWEMRFDYMKTWCFHSGNLQPGLDSLRTSQLCSTQNQPLKLRDWKLDLTTQSCKCLALRPE